MCPTSCVEVVGDWLYHPRHWLESLKKTPRGELGNGFELGDRRKMLRDFAVMEMKLIRRAPVPMSAYDNFRRGCDLAQRLLAA